MEVKTESRIEQKFRKEFGTFDIVLTTMSHDEFPIHSHIFMEKSEYFRSLFSQKIKENCYAKIAIREESRYMNKIIQFVYGEKKALVFKACPDALSVLVLAREFGLNEYEKECEKYLIEKNYSQVNYEQYVEGAKKMEVSKLIPYLSSISRTFFTIFMKANVERFPNEVIKNVLNFHDKNFNTNLDDCALRKWIELVNWGKIDRETYIELMKYHSKKIVSDDSMKKIEEKIGDEIKNLVVASFDKENVIFVYWF